MHPYSTYDRGEGTIYYILYTIYCIYSHAHAILKSQHTNQTRMPNDFFDVSVMNVASVVTRSAEESAMTNGFIFCK